MKNRRVLSLVVGTAFAAMTIMPLGVSAMQLSADGGGSTKKTQDLSKISQPITKQYQEQIAAKVKAQKEKAAKEKAAKAAAVKAAKEKAAQEKAAKAAAAKAAKEKAAKGKVTASTAAAKLTGIVTGDVWIHKTADFDESSRLGVAKKGQTVVISGSNNNSYFIGNGYVSRKYVKVTGKALSQ